MFTLIKELLELLVRFGDNFFVWYQSLKISIRQNWELISVIIFLLLMLFILYKIKKWKDQKTVE